MLPSLFVMLLFIAVPIVSVAYQSLYVQHEQILVKTQNCGPFGCTDVVSVDTAAMARQREESPMGRFNWLGTYANPSHLAFGEIGRIWQAAPDAGAALERILNLPFYAALAFTAAYTAIVTPLAIVLGFLIALAVNAIPKLIKGPVIFFSLLPMIVTPLVGSLVLFWMIDAKGVVGANLQVLLGDPELSLKASPILTWVTLFTYGIWHSAPFSLVVFYAGLQTVPGDTVESAMIDGASRWERVRFVIIPHLAPLVTFVALVQLMDNFRVFEPIIGFSAGANASSLSSLIYSDLRGTDQPLFGSAAATSMLTVAGIVVLLTPVLLRTWREFNRRA